MSILVRRETIFLRREEMTIKKFRLITASSGEAGSWAERGVHNGWGGFWVTGNISFVDLVTITQCFALQFFNCKYKF